MLPEMFLLRDMVILFGLAVFTVVLFRRLMFPSIIGFLFTGNMGLSAIAPIVTGFVADGYGLSNALHFVGLFPFLACLVSLGAMISLRGPRS